MTPLDNISIDWFGVLICSLSCLCFGVAVYFAAFYKKRIRKRDIILALLWASVAIYFFIHTSVLFLLPYSQEIGYKLLYVSYFFLFAQIIFASFYIITKATKKLWIKVFTGVLLLIFLGQINFLFITQSTPAFTEQGEPYLQVSSEIPVGYAGAFIVSVIFVLAVLLIRRDFKTGAISWRDMRLLYKWYALILYVSMALLRVLHFLPYPWYIEIFYVFVPYLMYLSKKDD